MNRSNFTMCTFKKGEKKMSNGQIAVSYLSYIFGGLVLNQYGQL